MSAPITLRSTIHRAPLAKMRRAAAGIEVSQYAGQIRRLKKVLNGEVTQASLHLLAQAFSNFPSAQRTALYHALIKDCKDFALKAFDSFSFPPVETEVRWENMGVTMRIGEMEKNINAFFRAIEPKVEGRDFVFRLKVTPLYASWFLGAAREFSHHEMKVMDFYEMEGNVHCGLLDILNDKMNFPDGFLEPEDRDTIFLTYLPNAKIIEYLEDLVRHTVPSDNPYMNMFLPSLPREMEARARINIVKALFQPKLETGKLTRTKAYEQLDALMKKMVLEHEYGHVLVERKVPDFIALSRISMGPNAGREIPPMIEHALSKYEECLSAVNEFLADLEGPLTLVLKLHEKDEVLAHELFMAYLLRRHLKAQPPRNVVSDNNVNILNIMVRCLSEKKGKIEVDWEKLSSLMKHYSIIAYNLHCGLVDTILGRTKLPKPKGFSDFHAEIDQPLTGELFDGKYFRVRYIDKFNRINYIINNWKLA